MYVETREQPSSARIAGIATICMLQCFNCGFALSGNTDVGSIIAVQDDWGDDTDMKNTLVSTSAVCGLTLGALMSKYLTEWGRRRTSLLANFVITLSTIPNFFCCNFGVFMVTRFVLGFFAAMLVNASSLYISETVPTELQSKVGIVINLGIVLGIFFTCLFGLTLPEESESLKVESDNLWRVSYSLQLIPIFITTLMWLLLFRNEPVKFLISKAGKSGMDPGSSSEARQAIRRNYSIVEEQAQIEQCAQIANDLSANQCQSTSVGYKAALTDPRYRKATIISVILAFSNQLTGINAINIYSTEIYKDIQEESGGGGISPRVGSVLNASAQVFACLTSPLVTYFSFRTIINGGFLAMGILMCGVATLAIFELNNALVVVLMIFLAFYQWTLGTYAWVYVGAVACEEGLSIATMSIWLGVVILSLSTNSMFDTLHSSGTFFFFAAGSLISAAFFQWQLKETKGLTRDEAQVIYAEKINAQQTDIAPTKVSIGGTTEYSETTHLVESKSSQ